MKCKPVGPKVLAKLVPDVEQTPGGLYIPQTAVNRENHLKAIVMEVGKKVIGINGVQTEVPMDVQVGDVIVIERARYQITKLDDVEYVIVSEDKILGVIEE